MKRITGLLLLLVVLFSACKRTERNPLMTQADTPYQTPAYNLIKNEYFYPAFVWAMDKQQKEVDAIAKNPDPATFENTIEALEFSGADLARISGIFFNLKSSCTNDTLQRVAEKIAPMMVDAQNHIFLNEKLFGRVKTVYENRAALTGDALRLTENTYNAFYREGAALSKEDKAVFADISKQLADLSLKFGENVLKATDAFSLEVTDKQQLDGLPDFVIETAAEEARQRGKQGWVFTLYAPSYGPFMQYSTNRELREKMWRAANTKCVGGEFDNTQIVKQIANLRLQLAKLMGYSNYADYGLADKMAGNAKTVNTFLNQLLTKSLPYARTDIAQVRAFAASQGAVGELMPWDFSYYSNKLQEQKYALKDEDLKPYFRLENAEKGVFSLAEKLYGITIKANNTIPKYHPDVNVYEVFDNDGKFLAVLYTDYFPRSNKEGGAWMNSIREQRIRNGEEQRPLITLNGNFTKPTPTTPSLLTFDEVVTLLHEFGHGLHGIFSQGAYSSLAGTNVSRDFVELPSQIMENWATEKDFLSSWAVHYQTGDTIPAELIDKIITAKNYLAGYSNIRQLMFGIDDMAWHTITEPFEGDPTAFEAAAIAQTAVLPTVPGTAFSTSFGHIFNGGYEAGYYSYKWAEVLEADAFSRFRENGIFDRKTAESFRSKILSRGDAADAMELYKDFMGREPRVESLFEKYNLK